MAVAGFDAGDLRSIADLRRLPLLEKSDLDRAGADALRTRQTRWRRTMRSAGTSGQPVTVHVDLPAWIRTLARRRHLFAQHGLTFGHREARCWGRQHDGSVSTLDRLVSRRVFTFEANDTTSRDAEFGALRAFRPTYVYGYSSVVREVVDHVRARGLAVPPLQAVVLTAERVPADLVTDIREVLGCPVLREYGCSEVDIIAFDCPRGHYHVLSDHVIVEAVDVEDGIGEAVITDLDNTLQPLIRYRLGDRIRLATDPCECGRTSPRILGIEGRTGGARYLVLPDGSRKHSVLFAYLFEKLRDEGVPIRQFRVQQTGPDALRVYLDLGEGRLDDDLADVIKARIVDRVGTLMDVEIEPGSLHRAPGSKWNYFVPLP
jgi:phenylacetate-CoA ligase